MRASRKWRAWAIAAAATAALLAASGATAFSVPVGASTSPHRIVHGYAVTNASLWADRAGDSVWCTVFDFGCGAPTPRSTSDTDRPVATLNQGEDVTIDCWKGTYYLVEYDLGNHFGWAVADLAVRPSQTERAPQECTLLDEAS